MESDTRQPPILICYDGSDDAREAVKQAADAFRGRDAEVVTVWESFRVYSAAYVGVWSENVDDDMRSEAERLAAEGAALANDHGLHARGRALHARGTVARTILDLLDDGQYSAVAVGTQGHSAIGGALLGSVSHAVAHRSPVPVLLVKPRPATKDRTPPDRELQASA